MERTVKINISDEEKERLFELLGKHGLTVGELFENVIGDLVGQGNGSDEKDLIAQWFDRCWFSFEPEETLLKHCLEWGYDIDDVLTAWDECEYYKSHLDEDKPEWIEEDLNEYIGKYKSNHPDKNIEEQINICRKWLEERQVF